MQKQLVANKWQAPDGTILWSKHRHDFVSHVDTTNGKFYAIDGGNDYYRCLGDFNDLKDLCVYTTDSHEVIRNNFLWKTYGKDGKQPGKYIALKDMQTEHIQAILETQWHIKGTYVQDIFINEIEFRKGVNK